MKKNMKKWVDPRLTQIALYVIATFLVIVILTKLMGGAGTAAAAVAKGLHWLGVILKPLLAGFAFAYILYPVAVFFERRLLKLAYFQKREKTAHSLAVAITWLLIAAGIFAMLSIVISAVSRELRTIQAEDILEFLTAFFASVENMLTQISNWIGQLNVSSADVQNALENLIENLQGMAAAAGEKTASSLASLPGFLTNLLFAVIFGVYFMLDSTGLMRYWDRVLKALTGKSGYTAVHRFIKDADSVFSGYIRGQLMDAVIMCIMISMALSLVKVPFAVIIGLMTGIGNLIPYVGPVIAYLSVVLVCLIHFDLQKLILAVIVVFVIQTIDGNVINPRLLAHSISVHPMLVVAALLVGGAFGGVLGMLLAVPVTALIKIYFDRLISFMLDRREQRILKEEKILKKIKDPEEGSEGQ